MASQEQALLGELSEASATGAIAQIYAEIRRFSGVPYVSSLQRYLATLPGLLEWAWAAIRPAMVSGAIPETGWRLARAVRVSPAVSVSAATLRDRGITASDLTAIRNVANNFVRVSPVNLMIGACLARLLNGATPSGSGFADNWMPPAVLPAMPGNVDLSQLPPDQRGVLMQFAVEVDGTPFIPALYRQIAHWPAVLVWLASELTARFAATETVAARAAFKTAAQNAAPDIVDRLPGLPKTAPPDQYTTQRVLAAIDRYAETSPEMTMFGQLILDTLPNTSAR